MRDRMRTRGRGEDGAALELALIFLAAIALIVSTLLGFAGTSSQATVVTRTSRGNDYDADAAMQAAIATIRVATTEGYVGSCLTGGYVPTFTQPLTADDNVCLQSQEVRVQSVSMIV